MDATDLMARVGVDDASLAAIASGFSAGDFEMDGSPAARGGSHLDAVGKRRVTVVYDAAAVQRVSAIARGRGTTPSAVYREALDLYLGSVAG